MIIGISVTVVLVPGLIIMIVYLMVKRRRQTIVDVMFTEEMKSKDSMPIVVVPNLARKGISPTKEGKSPTRI